MVDGDVSVRVVGERVAEHLETEGTAKEVGPPYAAGPVTALAAGTSRTRVW